MTTAPTINRRPFSLGQTYSTPGALETLHPQDCFDAIKRHAGCDWGNCCPDDWAENDFALDKYLRLFSVYHDRNGVKFWIITEADRSVTTILLPSEY
jgi:hypothetical protein